MKETAIEWFYKKLITGKFTGNDTIEFLYETAKEMEKEQIIDAYDKGEWNDGMNGDAEQYYNKKFKSE